MEACGWHGCRRRRAGQGCGSVGVRHEPAHGLRAAAEDGAQPRGLGFDRDEVGCGDRRDLRRGRDLGHWLDGQLGHDGVDAIGGERRLRSSWRRDGARVGRAEARSREVHGGESSVAGLAARVAALDPVAALADGGMELRVWLRLGRAQGQRLMQVQRCRALANRRRAEGRGRKVQRRELLALSGGRTHREGALGKSKSLRYVQHATARPIWQARIAPAFEPCSTGGGQRYRRQLDSHMRNPGTGRFSCARLHQPPPCPLPPSPVQRRRSAAEDRRPCTRGAHAAREGGRRQWRRRH
ncbi:MAG: hypothetical protein JWO69_536 [Thermoleophilia bacterium]|nr:hypothetical protein [Thermoleophilia bacterium]